MPCGYWGPEGRAHAGLRCEEAQRRHFLRIWNLKEAYCKAQGRGIISSMRHTSFLLWNASRRPGCQLAAVAENGSEGGGSQGQTQPRAWQVAVRPGDDRAVLRVIDFDEGHTAALCLLDGGAGHLAGVQHFGLPVLTGAGVPVSLGQTQLCC